MTVNLEDLKRRLFWASAYLEQEGSDMGSIPILIKLAERLAAGQIGDDDVIEELATLVASGTLDARLLGRAGDHPAIVKAVTDKLLQPLVKSESSLPRVDCDARRSRDR